MHSSKNRLSRCQQIFPDLKLKQKWLLGSIDTYPFELYLRFPIQNIHNKWPVKRKTKMYINRIHGKHIYIPCMRTHTKIVVETVATKSLLSKRIHIHDLKVNSIIHNNTYYNIVIFHLIYSTIYQCLSLVLYFCLVFFSSSFFCVAYRYARKSKF